MTLPCDSIALPGDTVTVVVPSEPTSVVLTTVDTTIVNTENPAVTLLTPTDVIILETNGGTGPQGPPGPPGPAGGAYFLYTQSTPAGTWIINHGLSLQYVSVTIYNTSGTQVDSDVVASSFNTVTISFSLPQAGFAVIVG